MRRRRKATIDDLRLAIDGLPRHTKIAMLDGVRTNEIIVCFDSPNGGICPMLAAHRAGGRTNFISFVKARGSFCSGDSRSRAARRAPSVSCGSWGRTWRRASSPSRWVRPISRPPWATTERSWRATARAHPRPRPQPTSRRSPSDPAIRT